MAAAGHAEASRWLHYGLTSNDVVDTAQALLIQQTSALLVRGMECLCEMLKRRALEFKDTVQVGRTHGVHAEPITFGLKVAIWYEEAGRDLARLKAAGRQVFGRCGHLRAYRSGRGGAHLRAPGSRAGPGHIAGDPAGSPCIFRGGVGTGGRAV